MVRKILIVEDYEDTRNLLKFIFESLGYEITEAADGFEAVESVKRAAPDNFNGLRHAGNERFDATKAIRKFEHGAKIPIICVTAYGRQIHKEALEAGFDDLIAKPIDFDSLPSVITQHLKEGELPNEPHQ